MVYRVVGVTVGVASVVVQCTVPTGKFAPKAGALANDVGVGSRGPFTLTATCGELHQRPRKIVPNDKPQPGEAQWRGNIARPQDQRLLLERTEGAEHDPAPTVGCIP